MATATNSTEGQILLSGDLAGTGESPQLRPTGATPGTYSTSFSSVAPDGTLTATVPALVVDSKGRVNFIRSRAATEQLETATSTTVGAVKVDGTTITSNAGTLSVNTSNLPIATNSTLGIARTDNSSFYVDPGGRIGIITAASNRRGKVMPDGTTMEMDGDFLKVKDIQCTATTLGTVQSPLTTNVQVRSGGVLVVVPPVATATTLGSVRPDGTTISVDSSGIISANMVPIAGSNSIGTARSDNTTITITDGVLTTVLPTATSSTKGAVRPDGTSVTISTGTLTANLSSNIATSSVLGIVRPDSTTLTIDGSNNISLTSDFSRSSANRYTVAQFNAPKTAASLLNNTNYYLSKSEIAYNFVGNNFSIIADTGITNVAIEGFNETDGDMAGTQSTFMLSRNTGSSATFTFNPTKFKIQGGNLLSFTGSNRLFFDMVTIKKSGSTIGLIYNQQIIA